MPLQIQRTANVYLLWDDGDVKLLFEELSAADWICTLTVVHGVWQVSLQKTATRQHVIAPTSDVVISDGMTVLAQTVEEYNADHPDNMIEVES